MQPHHTDAGWPQGSLLLVGSCLPILGATLLGPVLPDIQRHFAATPNVAILVPVMLTLPALMIALFSLTCGAVLDRFGRRRPLLIALALYGGFGVAPLWLNTLPLILLFRAGLGITEAMIMTACTTLIGDYFSGARREQWLALQGAAASFAAMLFFGVGGALGEFGWRTPFLLYAVGFVLLPLALFLLWETRAAAPDPVLLEPSVATRLPWRVLAIAYPFSVMTGVALLLMPVQAGYLLHELGVVSPGTIGLIAAANQGSVLIGALVYRLLIRFGFAQVFVAGFVLAGGGLLAVGAATGAGGVLAGGIADGVGCGILLVALINWAMGKLPVNVRGLGTGGFQGCIFLGEFISPLLILAFRHAGLSLSQAISVAGLALVLMATLGALAPRLAGSSKSGGKGELAGGGLA